MLSEMSSRSAVRGADPRRVGVEELEARVEVAVVVGEVPDRLDLGGDVVARMDLVPGVDAGRPSPGRILRETPVHGDGPRGPGEVDLRAAREAPSARLGHVRCKASRSTTGPIDSRGVGPYLLQPRPLARTPGREALGPRRDEGRTNLFLSVRLAACPLVPRHGAESFDASVAFPG